MPPKKSKQEKVAPAKKRAAKPRVNRPYPRASLETAVNLALQIKEKNGGNPMDTEKVAEAMGYSRMGPVFFSAAAAARDFKITEGSRDTDTIALTELGTSIVYAPDPETERAKKMDAFLGVEVFRKVLEYYKGTNLPEMKYLGNTLQKQFGLDPETHEEFSRLFRENCKYLGLEEGFEPINNQETEAGKKAPSVDRPSTVTLAEPQKGTGLVAFVIMPFVERDGAHPAGFFQEVLRSVITPAAMEAGFTVKTANRQGSDLIQSTIVNDLLEADLVIADLTEHNPNVLFELGIRMAQDKPIALIKATGTGRIFDVDNMLRVHEYNSNLWKTTLEKDVPALTEHLRGAWEKRESDQTYMKILGRVRTDPKLAN
jgi:hypothetical protein